MPPPREGPPLIPSVRASAGGGFVVRPASGADRDDAGEAAWGQEGEPDGPPLEVIEGAMRVELAEREGGAGREATPRAPRRSTDEEDEARLEAGLPEPEVLSERLAPELRTVLEELLRLRFARVKKIPRKHLVGGSEA